MHLFYRELANELLEQIVKPFKAFIDTQKEARKQVSFASLFVDVVLTQVLHSLCVL